jgi:signal transduction histidine kinase
VTAGRSLGAGSRIPIVLGIVFPAMIAAAFVLAYSAYQDVADSSSRLEAHVRTTADNQARDALEVVERRLNEEVHAFFGRVEAALRPPPLETPTDPTDPAATAVPPPDPCAVERGPVVTQYALYGDAAMASLECPRRPRRGDPQYEAVRHPMEELRRYFEWSKVEPQAPKYVHGPAGSTSALLVLTVLKGAEERTHYLVARLDLQHIREQLLDEALRKLGQSYRVAVFDERRQPLAGTTVGGAEPRQDERFVFEKPLGKALWAWSLRLAPREVDVETQQQRVERERVLRLALIALSTSIIAVGLGILLISVMAEQRTSRLKSDFIANVSHELKTPLSLIRMFGEMVATGRHKGAEAAREYGGIITRESERLSHLIDNVLDFARLERGKASYDFSAGDIAGVLERALDVCRYRLEREKVKLTVEIEPDLPAVRMDDNALTLAILNLVDNATKYAAEGGALEVSLRRAPGAVVIGVRDFGPGIPASEQGRIFERFYRASNARERNVRGSGIGLSLVEHIATAHGGRITVESPVEGWAPGAAPGAMFRLTLPAPVVAPVAEGDPGAVPREAQAGDTIPDAPPVARPR